MICQILFTDFPECLGKILIDFKNKKVLNNRNLILFLTICLSVTSSVYGIILVIISFKLNTSLGGSISDTLVRYSLGAILLSISTTGWIATLYQLTLLGEKRISDSLRRELLGNGNNREIYKVFASRGGFKRISIMESMKEPRLRNEIARTTKTDWKEVDRNLRILKSINLVKVQSLHESVSVYELTEQGREVLREVETILGETS